MDNKTFIKYYNRFLSLPRAKKGYTYETLMSLAEKISRGGIEYPSWLLNEYKEAVDYYINILKTEDFDKIKEYKHNIEKEYWNQLKIKINKARETRHKKEVIIKEKGEKLKSTLKVGDIIEVKSKSTLRLMEIYEITEDGIVGNYLVKKHIDKNDGFYTKTYHMATKLSKFIIRKVNDITLL
ncbi:hypothetical protein M0Q50_05795 [bacterium]|jgi:hypothetical protein|nr:hypothetical protein [bacterium]